jgi:hypothetical protein
MQKPKGGITENELLVISEAIIRLAASCPSAGRVVWKLDAGRHEPRLPMRRVTPKAATHSGLSTPSKAMARYGASPLAQPQRNDQ